MYQRVGVILTACGVKTCPKMFSPWLFAAILLKLAGITEGTTSSMSGNFIFKGPINIGIITASTNTSYLKSAMVEALKHTNIAKRKASVDTSLLVLVNYTTSLEYSLVQFCDRVSEGNITSVIITEPLLQTETGINFISWIASQLGIIVTLMRGIRAFPNTQDHEFNLVFSMKPIICEQSGAVAELASSYHWVDITILFVKEKSLLRLQVKELIRRIQLTKPLLVVKALEIQDNSNIRDNLHDIKASKSSLIVLYSSKTIARQILETAAKLKLFDGSHAWLITDSLTEDMSLLPWMPAGVLGMRLRSVQELTPLTQSLLHDSIVVSAQAQMLDNGSTETVTKNCYNVTRGSTNDNFLRRTLRKIKMTGKTGPIQFDQNGNRIKPDYDVLNLHQNSKGEKVWKLISYWSTSENKLIPNSRVSMKWIGGKTNQPTSSLNMREVRVATALTEPFAFYGSQSEEKIKDGKVVCDLGFPCKTYMSLGNGSSKLHIRCCKGFSIDLLRMLESDLGFKSDLHVVKDGKYGGFDPNTRTWNGLIGELMRGETDMAVADLTITDSRSNVVDFTQPFLHVGLSILVSVEKKRQAWLLRFLDPFSTELWFVTIITINVMFFLLWLIDKNSPYGHFKKGENYKEKKQFHLIASLWYTWGSVFRTDECESRPRSYSSRALAVVFVFGMLVVTNTYTANLAAVLVSENDAQSISGIQDPKLQNPMGEFTIGTVKETSMEKLFKESSDPVYSQIWKTMKNNKVNTFQEGVRKVLNSELSAFIGDEPTLLYYISKDKTCKLKLAGKPFFKSGFGVALPKNSSFTNKLSDILILYQERDTYRTLSKRWLSGTCSSQKPGQNFKEMTIDDVGGAYVIVVIGVFVSLLVLVFEFHVDKFGFPMSHIWTNKPDRGFPSTRKLLKQGIIRKKSAQLFSTATFELSIGQRRFIESMNCSSLNHVVFEEDKAEKSNKYVLKTDQYPGTLNNSSASLSCSLSTKM